MARRFDPARSYIVLFALPLVVSVGCTVPEVDLEGRACPCATELGYVCDESSNTCVSSPASETGVPDGGGPVVDSGRDTAPRRDSAAPDTGMDEDTGSPPPVDAGAIDTACDDALSGALFCDSFEEGALWTVPDEVTDGVVEVVEVSGGAYRGDRALRATTSVGRGFAELLTEFAPDGVTSGPLYVRSYVRIPSGFPITQINILHVGGHRDRYPAESLIGFNIFAGETDPSVTYAGMFVGVGLTDHVKPETVAIERDRWFCVQLDLELDPVAGSASVRIDGRLAGSVTGIDTTPPGTGFHHFGAGAGWTPAEQASTAVWIDEVAVGLTPLPCDP